ncbi:hypothetical protein [Streptomyces sp. NPDC051572]|uniref:hypothetical protein n=1 Tax=Streptomyces sp. NPDC051572 TaxID=3155802 RepID=UPI003450C3CC
MTGAADAPDEPATLLREARQAVRGRLPRGYDTIVELRAGRVELTLLGPQGTDRLRAAYWLDERLRSQGLYMRLDGAKPPCEVLGEWGENTIVTIERPGT